MHRILPRGQVDQPLELLGLGRVEQFQCMGTAVDDDHSLRRVAQCLDEGVVVHLAALHDAGAAQLAGEPHRIGRQFAALQRQAALLQLATVEGGLRGRAKHHRTTVMRAERVDHPQRGHQQLARQGLRLVQHDHRTGDIVQLAAARRTHREKTFEELHIGRDDQRRGPVLHGKAQLVLALRIGPFVVDGRMMLQHGITKKTAKNGCSLVDDRSIRNREYDPAMPVAHRVVQRKTQRGQRLAAAGGDGQRKKPRRHRGALPDMRQDIRAQAIDRTALVEPRQMRIEDASPFRQQIGQGRPVAIRPRAVQPGIEGLGIAEIGIDQAGEHHARRDRQIERGRAGPHPRSQLLGYRVEVRLGRRRDFWSDQIAEGIEPAFHAAVGIPAVRQPRMMAQDGIADHLGAGAQPRGRPGAKQRGAGRGMIHPDIVTAKDAIEGRIIFAEIMEEPGHMGRSPQPEGRCAFRSQCRRVFQVMLQQLPVTSILAIARMRVVVHQFHSSPTTATN
nr:hypothetical protein [Paracoccus pantotrophus]